MILCECCIFHCIVCFIIFIQCATKLKKIYYKIIIEKEFPDDDEPVIYGTLNDKRGDKLDIPDFVVTSKNVILHLSDGRYLKIVFLDESEEFEVDGGFKKE